MKQLAIVTDLDRCTGCHACTAACAQENHLLPDAFWTRVRKVGPHGRFPDLQMYFLPVACQHCAEPACVKACPTGASHKRADGIVLIDQRQCVGCRTCETACPYGVQSFDAIAQKVQKCTLCVHLVDHGEEPACVKTCTTGARLFGDMNDPASEVAQAVRRSQEHAFVLLPEAATRPSARFILRRQTWRGRA